MYINYRAFVDGYVCFGTKMLMKNNSTWCKSKTSEKFIFEEAIQLKEWFSVKKKVNFIN
jgi:hypothetical protein